MSDQGPTYWVQAEYSYILNVLDLADKMRTSGQSDAALLRAAADKIQERGLPDDPQSHAAVTSERTAVLGIIGDAIQRNDPLASALKAVSQRARRYLP